MKTSGRVIAKLEPRTGEGQNGMPWRADQIVIETEEQYSKKQCFTLKNKQHIFDALNIGDRVAIEATYSSREWNDKWFNQAEAYKIEFLDKVAAAPAPSQPEPAASDLDALFGPAK
jgi:hypothetical protein